MEILGSRRTTGSDGGGAATSLPTYKSAPEYDEVRLEEFEQFMIDRLTVLQKIQDGLSRGRKQEEMEKMINDIWKEKMRGQDAKVTIKKDLISHHALRLVFCREEEKRNWFLLMETNLFKYRFKNQTPDSQRVTLNELQLPYELLSHSEFENIKENLNQMARSIGQTSNVETIFYKVPFEDVPDLLSKSRVFMQKGVTFVPRSEVVSLVCNAFRSNISKALVLTNQKWRVIHEKEKDRLVPIFEALGNGYLGPDYSKPKDGAEISLKDINQLANNSFPLCMRHLFTKLREDHHLKYGGRMQLGLFLKGVGLKLEDALAFWKQEFSKKVGSDKFEKEYAYGIRHNYGKEGKRADYTPYSCKKIITANPSSGDHHGCPYRHFSEDNLRAALNKMGVASHAMNEILNKVRTRDYQVACTLTFEATHNASCDGINHPNQYFEQSKKIIQTKDQKS